MKSENFHFYKENHNHIFFFYFLLFSVYVFFFSSQLVAGFCFISYILYTVTKSSFFSCCFFLLRPFFFFLIFMVSHSIVCRLHPGDGEKVYLFASFILSGSSFGFLLSSDSRYSFVFSIYMRVVNLL